MVLEIFRDQLPVISIQAELIALKENIPCNPKEELNFTSGKSMIGICNGLQGKSGQVGVRFFNGVTKTIKVKDLNTVSNYQKIYTPGKVLRVAVNKLERLCTKQQVIDSAMTAEAKLTDLKAQVTAFSSQFSNGFKITAGEDEEETIDSPIGKVVTAEVQLIKDYGLICQIEEPLT